MKAKDANFRRKVAIDIYLRDYLEASRVQKTNEKKQLKTENEINKVNHVHVTISYNNSE